MDGKKKTVLTVGTIILLGLLGWTLWLSSGEGRGPKAMRPVTTAPTSDKPPVVTQPTPVSMWDVSESKDDVTGEVTKVAEAGLGSQNIVVRKKGKRLEVFVNTGEFLETMENVETGVSQVAYKFDDGPVTRQGWRLSGDNEGLFYPGDPTPFLEKLAKAKTFAFQYRPADKVPQSTTFDVSGFALDDFVGPGKAPAQHSPSRQLTAADQPLSANRETIFNYPECDQRDPSLSARDCSDRMRPGAPVVPQCAALATAEPGITQPEDYRECAAKAPK